MAECCQCLCYLYVSRSCVCLRYCRGSEHKEICETEAITQRRSDSARHTKHDASCKERMDQCQAIQRPRDRPAHCLWLPGCVARSNVHSCRLHTAVIRTVSKRHYFDQINQADDRGACVWSLLARCCGRCGVELGVAHCLVRSRCHVPPMMRTVGVGHRHRCSNRRQWWLLSDPETIGGSSHQSTGETSGGVRIAAASSCVSAVFQ